MYKGPQKSALAPRPLKIYCALRKGYKGKVIAVTGRGGP
jgi:hypothetical protein